MHQLAVYSVTSAGASRLMSNAGFMDIALPPSITRFFSRCCTNIVTTATSTTPATAAPTRVADVDADADELDGIPRADLLVLPVLPEDRGVYAPLHFGDVLFALVDESSTGTMLYPEAVADSVTVEVHPQYAIWNVGGLTSCSAAAAKSTWSTGDSGLYLDACRSAGVNLVPDSQLLRRVGCSSSGLHKVEPARRAQAGVALRERGALSRQTEACAESHATQRIG